MLIAMIRIYFIFIPLHLTPFMNVFLNACAKIHSRIIKITVLFFRLDTLQKVFFLED